MSRILFPALMILLLMACKSTPKNTNEEEQTLTYADFHDKFPAAASFKWDADSLHMKLSDSLALKDRVVKQFIPDTLAKGVFNAAEKPKFFPLAVIDAKDLKFDIYVIEGSAKSGDAAWLAIYDKSGNFVQRHLVARTGANRKIGFSIDKKLGIRVSSETGKSTRDEVFAPNPDGSLALILTNSNEPDGNVIYNPIDTLPRKHKFSANYISGKDIVSIRDGGTPKDFLFFIHFSRDNGACIGELDGTGRFTSANTGQFRDKQSSCIIDFKFTGSKITIRETGCGAYRGIKCMFEGTYTKKKK